MKAAFVQIEGIDDPFPPPLAPQINVAKWVETPPTFEIRLVPILGVGKFKVIVSLARQRGCRRIFEIGTFFGSTALALANAGFEVSTLDLRHPILRPEWDDGPWRWLVPERSGVLLDGTVVRQFFAPNNGESFDPGSEEHAYDLVFIDGDHARASVERDQNIALRLIRSGGTLVWDDAELPGVSAALGTFEAEHGDVCVSRDQLIAWWPLGVGA